MSGGTSIEWTDVTWNPVRGCSRISEGCRNCYAERVAARYSGPGLPFHGFAQRVGMRNAVDTSQRKSGWTGRVELIESKLEEPLHWRKPRRVFVNSMSDLFHESLPDEAIDRVFAVMALAPQHTFQVLTKRPQRMRDYLTGPAKLYGKSFSREESIRIRMTSSHAPPGKFAAWIPWPLPNVWLGASVEDKKTAAERLDELLKTQAARLFVSYEPALEQVDFAPWLPGFGRGFPTPGSAQIDWLIVGGESGPGARPFDVAWARSAIQQCRAARVPCFVKQLGAQPYCSSTDGFSKTFESEWGTRPKLVSKKGGDPSEWPADLRVREFPAVSVPR